MHLLKITGVLAALAFIFLPAAAWPADDVADTAKKLAEAAMILPPAQRGEVRHKALAIIVLAEYGRLLPRGLSPGQWEVLENIFLEGRFEDSVRRQQAATMPPADTVSFDGGRLEGGGFSRIDNIIGTSGSPIALDRCLPTRLIPLNPGEADLLHRAASAFTANPAGDGIRDRTDALYRARLDSRMAGDGIFYRPYAGRTDDLYYRLVQNNPGPASEMNFYAIAESLPARRYHPITGIGSPALVPSPWFSVSEILSGGGLLAVESFKSRSPHADVRNPFFGFAARVLPFLGAGLENSRLGGELNVSKDVIRRAIESPHRFTPKPVEPIFNDPSHFFGCLVPRFIRVARRMTRAEMAEEFRKIDFGTPLPDVPDEPAGNEVLVNPSKWTKAEFFQELPGILDLASTPQYNPDTDLFAGPTQGSGPQPVPGERQPSATTDIVLVQALPGPAPQQVVAGPPAATPPPADPLPSPMPLVASIPSPSPPAVESEPVATLATEEIIPEKTVASATPPPAAEPSPPAVAAATPAPPAPIAIPSEIELTAGGIAMEAPSPVLPADLLSVGLPLLAVAPPFGSHGAGLEPLPEFPSGLLEGPALSGPTYSKDDTAVVPPSRKLISADVLGGVEQASRLLFSLQAGNRDGRPTSPPPLEFVLSPAEPSALAAATPAPPAPIAIPSEIELPTGGIAMEAPSPVLPADFLSIDLPLPAAPAMPVRAEASPVFGPLLADHIAPDTPPAPPEIIPEKTVASNPLPPAAEPTPPAVAAATPSQPPPILPDEALASASPSPLPASHYLAVVTPDISASEKYLGDISASDAVLSKNAAAFNRTNCYLQWLKAALDPVEAYLDSSPGLAQAQKAGLQAAASAAGNELNSLLENRHSLSKERDQLLLERGRLRSLIEGEPLRLTTAKLDALLGRPIDVSNLVAQETSRNPKRSLKFSAELPNLNFRGCFASNN